MSPYVTSGSDGGALISSVRGASSGANHRIPPTTTTARAANKIPTSLQLGPVAGSTFATDSLDAEVFWVAEAEEADETEEESDLELSTTIGIGTEGSTLAGAGECSGAGNVFWGSVFE